jgi:hypothetical protein
MLNEKLIRMGGASCGIAAAHRPIARPALRSLCGYRD